MTNYDILYTVATTGVKESKSSNNQITNMWNQAIAWWNKHRSEKVDSNTQMNEINKYDNITRLLE